MKVLFMGTPAYATQILARLYDEFEVTGLVTMPDKKVGRKQILTPPDTKKWALDKGASFEIFQPQSLKNEEIYSQILALKPDFIVVAAYGKILPKNILEICPCINLHASILPQFRGASPIQSMILGGANIGGVTAMLMGEGLDDGDILAYSFCDISGKKSDELFDKFGKMASELCVKVLKNYDEISPIAQISADASKCTKITKADGEIDFDENIDSVMAKFRAFYPWPGVFLKGGIKLNEIYKFSDDCVNLGEISRIENDYFTLGFKGGEIAVKRLQIPSKNETNAKDFINGKRLKIGDRIS